MIPVQPDLERLLDVRNSPANVERYPVAVRGDHAQSLLPGEIYERLVILLRRPKPLRELLRRQGTWRNRGLAGSDMSCTSRASSFVLRSGSPINR